MNEKVINEGLEKILTKNKEVFSPPSISLSLYYKGESFYKNIGYSSIEDKKEATKDTIYAIASASKAFIATSICILCQEGKMDLDKPIKTYIDDFKMYTDYLSNHLYVRDALSHRTGLSRNDLTWFNQPDNTIEDMVKLLQYIPPAYEIRYRMHYQNHMFTLATYLVEKISGISWKDFLKERIFKPLGMKNTYPVENLVEDSLQKATPYKIINEKITKIPHRDLENIGSTGSIYSTTEDLLKWARFHLEGNEDILSNKYLSQLHSPQTIIKEGDMSPISFAPEVDFTAYGMGWFIENYRNHKLVHHGGTIDGFKSIVGFLPEEDIALSVLTNLNGNQSPQAILYEVIDLLLELEKVDWSNRIFNDYDRLSKKQIDNFNETKEKYRKEIIELENKKEYTGKYKHPAFGEVEFIEKDDELYMVFANSNILIKYIGHDTFIPDSDILLEFPQMYEPICFSRKDNHIKEVGIVLDDKILTPYIFTLIK